jgi:DNA/RNA endonuclease G (NUC1)
MRTPARVLAIASLIALGSCSVDAPTAPESTATLHQGRAAIVGPLVRISELHYDNAGTDAGEAIEISGPAGTDLTGWSLVLYNGATTSLSTYNTRALTATIPATCGERGVIVEAYPVNGIQNGNPDGVALVDAGGVVVEFLSYGGTFVAANGPAIGLASVDIGAAESATTLAGASLGRTEAGTWTAPAPNTFGACNDGSTNEEPVEVASVELDRESGTVTVGGTLALTAIARDAEGVAVVATLTWASSDVGIATVDAAGLVTAVAEGEAVISATAERGATDAAMITVEAGGDPGGLPPVRFSEIHYDNDGTDVGEAIEVEGPAGTDLTGWRIVLYNQTGGVQYGTTTLSGVIPDLCEGRGVLVVNYPANGIQNGPADGFALVDAADAVIEFLSYEGTLVASNGLATGMTSVDIGVSEASTAQLGRSLQRDGEGTWSGPALSSFGNCNADGPTLPANSISFSGRLAADPPLPVGFEDQVFATLRDGNGATVPTTFTWTSETPAIATIDAAGVMHALAAGTAVLRATAAEGTTATYSLPTHVALPSLTALYAGHTEFGAPADGDASDDLIVTRAQYVASFNPVRGIPNWVSFNLEATHFGPEDRCDCFTFDPELPASVARYTTADYTGAGAIAGFGIDRGHLARSFDRTAGALDNATTYYFTNIIPQTADNNQGPWAEMENAVGDSARFGGREVYVIAGASGSAGTVKNEGRITIPSQVWKVVVILPHDAGLASVDSWDDVTVMAAIMPNIPGIRNVDWHTYLTTVDAVESLSGYDLLALLRDDIEVAVESGTRPPVAALDGPWSVYAGDPLSMSASGSTDADGDALTFSWSFGDGATAGPTGSVTHTYAAPGTYPVRVIVTDPLGLADTVTASATVTLLPPAEGIARAQEMIAALVAAGTLSAGEAESLQAKLSAAARAVVRGNSPAADGALGALASEIDALVRSGRLTEAAAAPLLEIIARSRANLAP